MPIRVTNYDDVKGYVEDDRFVRVVIAKTIFLYPQEFQSINYALEVLSDDGEQTEVYARKITNPRTLEMIAKEIEKLGREASREA